MKSHIKSRDVPASDEFFKQFTGDRSAMFDFLLGEEVKSPLTSKYSSKIITDGPGLSLTAPEFSGNVNKALNNL